MNNSLCAIKKKIIMSQKGFTLVELMLYMALMSIFLVVLTELFLSTLETKKESDAISSVEQDGRFILARLSFDLNRASQVTTPSSVGSTTQNLTVVINGNPYTYELTGNNLTLTGVSTTDNLNNSGSAISNLSFQRIGQGGKPTIKFSFTATSKIQRVSGPETKEFTTTVGLR